MSHSPSGKSGDEASDYIRGWSTINRLIRRGYSWSGYERKNAFLNLGGGRFVDASFVAGFDFLDDGRAASISDWDLDGDPDLFLTNRNTPRLRFLRNETESGGSSLWLRLVQPGGNGDAIGARVELELEGGPAPLLVRSVRAGEGYLAQSSAALHFGLGNGRPKRAVVHWPLGGAEAFADLERGGSYVLARGSGRAAQSSRGSRGAPRDPVSIEDPSLANTPSVSWPEGEGGTRIVLASSVPMPKLVVRSSSGVDLTLFGVKPGAEGTGTGRPVLLNLWTRTCASCLAELAEVAARRTDLEVSGLAFLALCVDEDADAARATMEELGWPFAWGFAGRETIDVLDALHGAILDRETPLPLPASYFIDERGNWRVLWLGRVDVETLLADRELAGAMPEEMRAQATPFRGRWLRPAETVDVGFFERKLAVRGLTSAAEEFSRARIQVLETTPAKLLHEFGRAALERGRVEEAIANFRRAVEADPNHFQAFFDLGFVLHQRGELDEAISAYRAALRLDPEHEDAHFNLALAELVRGDLEGVGRELAWLREKESALASELERAIELARAERPEKPR